MRGRHRTMDQIILSDLEVHFRVGVTEAERACPQRLLISVEMGHDLSGAASADALSKTIDYQEVTTALLRLGDDRCWALIETVAADVARLILDQFKAAQVTVEVRKFVIPQARYVSVRLRRPQ